MRIAAIFTVVALLGAGTGTVTAYNPDPAGPYRVQYIYDVGEGPVTVTFAEVATLAEAGEAFTELTAQIAQTDSDLHRWLRRGELKRWRIKPAGN